MSDYITINISLVLSEVTSWTSHCDPEFGYSVSDSESSPDLSPINPSLGIWLTGDLTNHNTESAILSDKQTRQERRLILVDLSLKNSVYWCLSTVKNKIASDVRSCLFCAMTIKRKTWWVRMPLELRCYSDLSRHIKEPQNGIYCLNFLQNEIIWKLRLFHTESNLLCLVCRCVVSFLFAPRCIFHCVRTWCVAWECMACRTQQQLLRVFRKPPWVFAKDQLWMNLYLLRSLRFWTNFFWVQSNPSYV